MRRKIAAILVAHVAEYGRLVADDEEETLRRLASYRTTTDDLIAIAGGRIFNAAGDAFLAEFPSAVEAVRCAIDIQESLRTRNLAYPDSRQMSYRIGIGIGDVVEREGDLLGDGVNIAARLEGLAEAGGICISRAVYEQVINKLSARFVDIGARKVKNIPEPVHAYLVVTWDDGRTSAKPQVTATPATARSVKKWLSVAVIGAVVLCTAALAFFLSCNPETRRQRVIEFNRCRNTAAGADAAISIIVNISDILITPDIVNARSAHPSHQFG
jgi:adenylate cyclase